MIGKCQKTKRKKGLRKWPNSHKWQSSCLGMLNTWNLMYGPPEMEIEICAKREQAGSCLSQRMVYAFLSFYRWFVQVPTLMNILRAFQWVIVGSLPEESFEEEKNIYFRLLWWWLANAFVYLFLLNKSTHPVLINNRYYYQLFIILSYYICL